MFSRCRVRSIFSLMCFLLTFTALVGNAETANGAWTAPDGFREAAQRDAMELWVHDSDGTVIVHDAGAGVAWRSSPVPSQEAENYADSLRQYLFSPFKLRYTDGERRLVYEVHHGTPEKVQCTVESIPNGVRFDYVLTDTVYFGSTSEVRFQGAIRFSIDFVLGEGSFKASIPDDRISEEGELHIVSIQLLPFFGANRYTADGFFLLPLGHGVSIPFTDTQPDYAHYLTLAQPIFGSDEFSFAAQRQLLTNALPEEIAKNVQRYQIQPDPAVLPVFSMVAGDRGFVGIVSRGSTDAEIMVGQYGYIMSYNRIGIDFVYRRLYTTYLSRTKTVHAFQKDRIEADREVEYRFLYDSGLDCVRAAEVFRSHLPAVDELAAADTDPVLNIRIFCGVAKQGLLTRELVKATSFSQAETIVDTLLERGIDDFSVTLVGWTKDGYYGRLPNKLPPDREFGGRRELRRFIEHAHEHEIPVYLETDYTIAYSSSRRFAEQRDSIKKPMDVPRTDGSGTYLLSPNLAFERFAEREIPQIASYGADGLVINNLGNVLVSNHDRRNRTSRREAADYYLKILELVRDNGMKVFLTGTNGFTLGAVDGYHEIPPFAKPFFYARNEVPFGPTVLRGYLPVHGESLNKSDDLQIDMLRLIEYGMLPAFELTYRDPVVLRDTSYNGLLSSEYSGWMPKIEEVYRTFASDLGPIRGRRITGHERLAEDVFVTSYDNGLSVLVNYGDADFTLRDVIVDSRDFVLVETGAWQ